MKNFQKNKLNSKYRGFSLLEMLISMFIFILTITTAVSIFVGVAFARKESRKIQENMEDARTALDLMAKNMRMSSGLGPNGSTNEIYMHNNSQGQCISYKFEDGTLKIGQKDPLAEDDINCSSGHIGGYVFNPITSNNVSGNFQIVQTSSSNIPKVIGKATIAMTIDGVNLQTSVSFRDYNDIIQ